MTGRQRLTAATATLALGAATVGTVALVTDEPKDSTVSITVPTPYCGSVDRTRCETVVQADEDNQLDRGEQREAMDAGIDLHEDTRDETPPGVSLAEIKAGAQRTNALAEKELVTPEEPGGAQNYSCPARPVVNQSALSGRRVGVALHFTVSNPGSLDAIRGLFNTPSFGASSNYGFELLNGRCQQWVPEGRKSWAQGPANSAYVSIEMITKDRSRASWLATRAFKKGTLAALVRDILRRQGAPIRRVDPQGCVWPAGITDHDAIECGMTHWDVGKNFPWDRFLAQVRRGVSPAPLTTTQRKACDKLNFHRSKARAAGKWFPSRLARARELKKQIPTGRCLARPR